MARIHAYRILNQYFEDESFLNIALNEELKKINPEIEILAGGTAGVVYDEEDKIERASYIRREFSLANRNNK